MTAILSARKPTAPAPAVQMERQPQSGTVAAPELAETNFVDLRMRLHERLLDEIELSAIDKIPTDQFSHEIGNMVDRLLAEYQIATTDRERHLLVGEIIDEIIGLGPLEPLLKDDSVSDILINGYQNIYVERHGQLERVSVHFKDDQHLLRIITKIVTAVGRHVDEAHPFVDARLADGSRVNVVVPPIALDGPGLSIRKFSGRAMQLETLVGFGSITEPMKDLLAAMVRGRISVLISGGTGSGKTSMLNAMSGAIDPRERIITIEDAAELRLQQSHVMRMETRPPNVEGKGEVTQRDLVRNALRMRPDRIILGECRGAEAFDMLQAMNTGHEGSMSTIHANTPRDALSRLEQMIGMAGTEMSARTVRAQIASAIHVVIQLSRFSDGKRRLTSIDEVSSIEGEMITMNQIFRFVRTSTDEAGVIHGYFEATGIRPKFVQDLATKGIDLPINIFYPDHNTIESQA